MNRNTSDNIAILQTPSPLANLLDACFCCVCLWPRDVEVWGLSGSWASSNGAGRNVSTCDCCGGTTEPLKARNSDLHRSKTGASTDSYLLNGSPT
eukprot:5879103-Amphidinium_carterae.1